MDVQLAMLERLEEIILEVRDKTVPRARLFKEAQEILDSVEKIARKKGLAGTTTTKIGELRSSVNAAFGSTDNNGHSEEQHRVWALGHIEALLGPQCFGQQKG